MWFILLISLFFILPAIAVKTLRSKLLYFLNATIVTWVMIEASKPFIEQAYSGNVENINSIKILSLVILPIFSVFYLIYGVIKLYKRKITFTKIFSNSHEFNFKDSISGSLKGEEKIALSASLPGVSIAIFIIIIYALQTQ